MKLTKYMIFLIILTILFWGISAPSFALSDSEGEQYEDQILESPKPVKGKVLRVIREENKSFETSGDDFTMRYQEVEVKVLQGSHKNQVLIIDNYIDAYNMVVDEGYHVLLYMDEDEEGNLVNAFIMEIVRERYLYYMVASFMLLLIILGGFKGVKVIITLVLTALAVVKILIPLILRGYPPVILSVAICIGVIVVTLFLISGINKKTLSAIIGTTGGILLAGAIALMVGSTAKLTGMGNEYAQLLMYIPQNINFDFKGLLFAGIILGSMGAVMDVSMSISSAMHEIEIVKPDISAKELIRSGLNIGRDVMGTMSNTLILAYAGGSLHLMLLFAAYDVPFVEIINKDIIASEVLRAMAGSIGLLFVIPLTALVAGTIGRKKTSTPEVNTIEQTS